MTLTRVSPLADDHRVKYVVLVSSSVLRPGVDTLVFRGWVGELCAPLPLCHLILASLYLFLCTHMLAISFLLLMFDWSVHAFMICSFSEVHRSHILFPGAYLLHFLMIDHSMSGFGFSPSSHTNTDSAVLVFFIFISKAV